MRRDERIIEVLRCKPMTCYELSDITGMAKNIIIQAMMTLKKYRMVKIISGTGVQGDPFVYALWDWQGPVHLPVYDEKSPHVEDLTSPSNRDSIIEQMVIRSLLTGPKNLAEISDVTGLEWVETFLGIQGLCHDKRIRRYESQPHGIDRWCLS